MHTSFFITLCLVAFSSPLQTNAEVDCPPDGISFIPDDSNCTIYYICAQGESNLMTCPEGFYFNSQIHECDFPENVPECVGGTRPPVTEPTLAPSSTTTTVTQSTTQQTTTTTGNPTGPTEEPPSDVLTECGDTFVGNKGSIEYKLNDAYESRLRCAFIVRSFNHSGFLFSLEENGLQEDPQIQGGLINIFSFGAAGLMDIVNLGPPNPLNLTYVTGSAVVVVFRSQGYRGRGFRLRFEGVGNFKYDFVNWNDVILSAPAQLKYPSSGKYEFNVLSLFVLSNNHQEVLSPNQILRLNVTDIDIETCISGCTCDFLGVYSFQANNLDTLDKICNESGSDLVYETDGIFILLFKSDHANNADGFSVNYSLVNK